MPDKTSLNDPSPISHDEMDYHIQDEQPKTPQVVTVDHTPQLALEKLAPVRRVGVASLAAYNWLEEVPEFLQTFDLHMTLLN